MHEPQYLQEKNKVFLRNGFELRVRKDSADDMTDEGDISCAQRSPTVVGLELCALTKLIPNYGIADLAELLQLLATGFQSDEVSAGKLLLCVWCGVVWCGVVCRRC